MANPKTSWLLVALAVSSILRLTPSAGPMPALVESIAVAAPPVPAPVQDPYGIYGADNEDFSRLREAEALFEAAGLDLPELRIYFHHSQDECLGNLGLYSNYGDMNRIDICLSDPKLIRHELAHAWEFHNADDPTREAFMTEVGAETWNDHSKAHPARGVEQAAKTISWGIDSAPVQRINASHYAEDLARYELLTGQPSPRIAHL